MDMSNGEWWRRFEPFVDQMVQCVSRRYAGRVDREELRQAGLLAIVEAGSRYDPRREATFAGYVRLRVKGAVRDAARRESFRKERGQVARSFPDHEGEAVRLSRVSADTLDSPFTPLARDGYSVAPEGGRASIESEVFYRDFVRTLRGRLAALPEQERRSVEACDLEGLSFVRAGERMGYTGGGVFRMRQRALGKLRDGYGGETGGRGASAVR